MAMDEKLFHAMVEQTLGRWLDRLEDAEGLDEVGLADGVLQAVTADGKTFILNRHVPLKQIWLSSPVSGAHHYAWDEGSAEWRSTRSGERLDDRVMADLKSLGIEVDTHV